MPIIPQDLVRHELIGLEVEIKESKNPSQVGLKGRVIGETYSTLEIETKRGEKIIPKDIAIFIFKLPDGTKVQVDGKILIGRPEDRIKKKFPRW
ncbi:MAG: ribonuclease P protein component 1 [Candidatus Aenigmarchaeota archaeon]|nr:ribonuclease P protein component 1 [Candidatus Aenigmarchaeota archaeon]